MTEARTHAEAEPRPAEGRNDGDTESASVSAANGAPAHSAPEASGRDGGPTHTPPEASRSDGGIEQLRRTAANGAQSVHSRATGVVRLVLAVWLMVTAVRTFADPYRAVAEQGQPLGVLLPLAGVSFTLGVFLLTGFMSRVAGLILVCLGAWEWLNLGPGGVPVVLALVGVYFVLRGGGAWAMDIYVQKVQDRARRKAALNAPQSS